MQLNDLLSVPHVRRLQLARHMGEGGEGGEGGLGGGGEGGGGEERAMQQPLHFGHRMASSSSQENDEASCAQVRRRQFTAQAWAFGSKPLLLPAIVGDGSRAASASQIMRTRS